MQMNFKELPDWQMMKLLDVKNVGAYWCVITNGAPL
jgi:hypothetical protein